MKSTVLAALGRLRDNGRSTFEVIRDGGEADLNGGFGELATSYSVQAVAASPSAEYPVSWRIHIKQRNQVVSMDIGAAIP